MASVFLLFSFHRLEQGGGALLLVTNEAPTPPHISPRYHIWLVILDLRVFVLSLFCCCCVSALCFMPVRRVMFKELTFSAFMLCGSEREEEPSHFRWRLTNKVRTTWGKQIRGPIVDGEEFKVSNNSRRIHMMENMVRSQFCFRCSQATFPTNFPFLGGFETL